MVYVNIVGLRNDIARDDSVSELRTFDPFVSFNSADRQYVLMLKSASCFSPFYIYMSHKQYPFPRVSYIFALLCM